MPFQDLQAFRGHTEPFPAVPDLFPDRIQIKPAHFVNDIEIFHSCKGGDPKDRFGQPDGLLLASFLVTKKHPEAGMQQFVVDLL